MRCAGLMLAALLASAAGLSALSARAQSRPSPEMFDGLQVVRGIAIDRAGCARLERQETAVWVTADGDSQCLRYYAAGLKRRGANAVAVGWMHGDLVGGPDTPRAGHQDGLGVAAMIAQEQALADRYGRPFVFIARPGAYGSSGRHEPSTSTRHEAALVAAQIEAITRRYRIRSWVLAGHSGGGTMAAEILNRRDDVRCAVISSGAPAHDAFLQAARLRNLAGLTLTAAERRERDAAFAEALAHFDLDPVRDVARMRPRPGLRVLILGDPRDRTVPFGSQAVYAEALKARGVAVAVTPLERAPPPKFHSLVDHAEAAAGLCAQGRPTAQIVQVLRAMPPEHERISN